MDNLSPGYLSRAETWLFVTLGAYLLMNGAQIFETAVLVPKWTAAPPESLGLLKGIDLKTFWIVMHSLHELTFLVAIVFCWQIAPVRYGLLLIFGIHFAVRVWTLVYFAPNIMAFQGMEAHTPATQVLLDKVRLWQILNYVRVGIFIALSLGLIPLYYYISNLRILHQ